MHKAIIFDLGRVLISFDFQLGYQALERACPHDCTEIRRRIASTGLVNLFERGLLEPAEFVGRVCAALDVKLDYEGFCRAWGSIFYEQILGDDLLESLATRYRLLLLSNTNVIHLEYIRANYPVLRHFHEMILSFEVHSMKPESEIFQAAIERAGCRPEECFFTDDLIENVEGARREGIDAVRFESAAQLEREMRARGILWT